MEGKNYIGGKWVSSLSGEAFDSISPADIEEKIGSFARSGEADVAVAVAAAREAYPAWRGISRIKRAEYLDAFAQIAKSETEALACLMAKEMGKALNEARADVTEGIHMAQYMFGRGRMSAGDFLASEIAEKDAHMLRRPKGVVTALTPWNFPFAIPIWLIAPSLLEGNTVVFKPSGETAAVGEKLVEYFEHAGLPPGVLNLVQGRGEEAGWPLVTHPDVDVVLFVGSAEVGGRIKQACAADYRKMVACEMGGKNGIIVFDDANLPLAVNAAVLSAFKTTGQRCTAASRLIVQEKILDQFVASFIQMTKRLTIGDPLDENVFMGPLVNEAGVKKVEFYNDLAKKEGGHVILDGGRLKGGIYDKGYFISPFVYIMRHDPRSRVLREEAFGPHVAVIPFSTIEEAIHIHNDTDYGLAFSVITEDYRKAKICRDECEYGVGYHNLPTIGAEVHLPFGGLKRSGTGLPSASTLVDVVSHRIAWTVNYAEQIKMAQGLSAEVI
ncbi:MAG: aldehyde dehydrogenase family protein [Chloroflexi bacterium]|nr:aldehyde dehydrogenase family protein [Chloroflexota bacterium]